jgi:hypothetical protein
MAQYSNPDKQRQPEGYELNKSRLSDADFTRRFRELFDTTGLNWIGFAKLVGCSPIVILDWYKGETSSLPVASERGKILARTEKKAARLQRQLMFIRALLKWLKKRRFSYDWVWLYFEDVAELKKSTKIHAPLDFPRNIIGEIERRELSEHRKSILLDVELFLRGTKPYSPLGGFQTLRFLRLKPTLREYVKRNRDLPAFSPDALIKICKSTGWTLTDLAREANARIDKASSISYYPEDCLDKFDENDLFKTPIVTVEYLQEIMSGLRKGINPGVWRVILDCSRGAVDQAAAETRTYPSPEQLSCGSLHKATAGVADVSRDKITKELVQFVARIVAQNIQSLAPETTQAFTQAINILYSYHLKRKANPDVRIAKQTILQLYETGFLQDHYLGISGLQSELARLLGCAESTVSEAIRTIKDRIRARQEEYYAERGRLVEYPQRDDD